MKKSIKRILCAMLVLVFIFANANVVLAADVFEIKPKFVSPTLYASSEEVALAAALPFDEEKFQAYLLEQLKVLPADEECIVEIDISQFKIPYTDENYQALLNLIWYESPELFRAESLGVSGFAILETLYVVCEPDFCDPRYFAECSDTMESVVADLVKGVKGNNNLSDVEKALILHDRLATYCEYDYDRLNDGTIPKVSYTAYGILGLGTGVCMGYALAYDYLLEQVGIKSDYCSSSPEKLNHAWNIVYINNKPYHVDVTWDDPVRDVSGKVLHDNFLRSTEGIKATGHNADDFTTTPTDTTYDDYFWQDSYTAFQLIDNKIYYIDNVKQELYVIDDITDTTPETIAPLNYEWTTADGAVYSDNYSKLASIRDNLFYSTPTEVYCYNTTEKTSEAIITDADILATTGEDGYRIYGMTAVGCTLWGEYVKSPNYNVNTKQEQTFTKGYHNPTENWKTVIEPTSSSQGEEKNYCIDCGREVGSRLIPALDDQHIWSDWYVDPNNKPTCTDKGVILRDCSHCGAQEWGYGTALGHDYSADFTIDVQPTCGITGVKYRACSRCDAKVDITTIPATNNHQASSVWSVGKAATCAEAGYEILPCVNCGLEMDRKTIAQLPHGETELVDVKSPTCTQEGYSGNQRCKVCKTIISYGTKTSKAAHKSSDWIIEKIPTLTQDGIKYRKCTDCEEKLETVVIPKLTHKSDGGTITKQPTCAEAGIKTFKCTKCGEVIKTESIPATGAHNSNTKIPGKVATCTATGLTDGAKCSVCGVVTKAQQVVPATGHKTTAVGKADATFKADGYTGDTKCTVCGVIIAKGAVIPKLVLTAPVISEAKVTTSGVKLSWGAVANAAQYKVYRKTYNASTKKWSKNVKIATVTNTEYVDSTVKLGTKYKYLIKAVNGNVTKNSKSTSTITFKISPTPKVYVKSNGLKVKWASVVSATEYRIYRSEYNASTKKWSSFKKVKTAKGSSKSWTDTKVTSGVKYKYCIKAVNGKVVCDKKKSDSLYYLTKPKATATKATNGIVVNWTQIKGTSKYRVYRSELQNGSWSSFKEIATPTGKVTSYTDTTTVVGVQYKYKVKAVKSKSGITSSETAVVIR